MPPIPSIAICAQDVDPGDQSPDGAASRDGPAGDRQRVPPTYSRVSRGSKLDPFKDEIRRLLAKDPNLPGVRVGELLEPLGWVGGKTVLDEYLREIRPLFLEARTTQRTILLGLPDVELADLAGSVRTSPPRAVL